MTDKSKQSALELLKSDFIKLFPTPEHWQTFADWTNQTEVTLAEARTNRRMIKKITRDLYDQFDKLTENWRRTSYGGNYFLVTSIAKYKPTLSNIVWESFRRSLHSTYYSLNPHYPDTISLYAAARALPTIWDLVKMQYSDKDWVDLCDFSRRVKSGYALACFIHAHLDNLGLTLGMYHTTLKILKESALLKGKKDIAEMAKTLTSAMEGLTEPSRDWIDFCGEAVKPVERTPVDEWFPVAPHLNVVVIDGTEAKTLDKLIKSLITPRRGSPTPLIKAWLEHTKSAKCQEPLSRMIIFLMTRAWIVRAYTDASEEYGANSDRYSGPLFDLKYAIERIIDEALRRKLNFAPEDFDVFVRLLQRLGRQFFPALPLISRCEEYAAQHPLTELQLSLLDRHFDNSNHTVDKERIKATERWKKLTARKKRRST